MIFITSFFGPICSFSLGLIEWWERLNVPLVQSPLIYLVGNTMFTVYELLNPQVLSGKTI